MSKITAAITGVQGYVPEKVLSNFDLEKMVDTSDEWIVTRTGIKERRILGDRPTSDIGVEAVNKLLDKKGIDPKEIDLVICGTITPDFIFPSTANVISDRTGMVNAWSFDVNAACSGFIYALTTGSQFIETGKYKKVMVIGADKMSSIIDYEDRSTCVIFGDGGGAVLLEPNQEGYGIIDSVLQSDGAGRKHLYLPAGGTELPTSHKTIDERLHYVHQDGRPVFKSAVQNMADVSVEIMERNNLTAENIDWLVPHQANLRIIDATATRMGLSKEKVMINIQKYGNTTAGTLPLCLWDWEHQLKKGDNLVLSAFGGGFTWGSIYIKWAYNS